MISQVKSHCVTTPNGGFESGKAQGNISLRGLDECIFDDNKSSRCPARLNPDPAFMGTFHTNDLIGLPMKPSDFAKREAGSVASK